MINDSFRLQLLKTSGTVNFRENNTILPCLYALLTLNFNLPRTLIWFEWRFPFYNTNFVSNISHLPYQAFCHRFLNFERHNERYEAHFYNDFLCLQTCEICIEHDSTYYSHVNFELCQFKDSASSPKPSKFRLFARDFDLDDQLFQFFSPAVPYHKCYSTCTLPIVHKCHFYCFTYNSMLTYAYYTNLTSQDKLLYQKCHIFHNNLCDDVFEILKNKLGNIYGIRHLQIFTIRNLSICELRMV